ncbi:uncharacterized protein LOC127839669 [Dreissena polymorpha]|uniref:uncharacterized protein LOC127839669 n=1 Tax=Dreissena polymorpha TaxID=45954 RepID=UPI002264BFF3|nr:uncharacterized protein LOC127839669 [Dreissena polymorpha]
MDKKLPPPPDIMSADDAAFHVPPPSYEEVMGVYQTSMKQAVQYLPRLAYIDLMPRCLKPGHIAEKIQPKFDNFSAIITGANRWLADHPEVAVWKCESIECPLSADAGGGLHYDLNGMIRHDSTFGFCCYIKGVRLWLTSAQPGSTPQQLGLRNIQPAKAVIELPTRYRQGKITIEGVVSPMMTNAFETLEGLEATVNKLNDTLKKDPISGTILTIETDTVKAFEGFKNDLDPESTCWCENKDKHRRLTQVIRIFYVRGPSSNEQIGMPSWIRDFCPEVTQQPDASKPGKFEPFDNPVDRMAQWISTQQGPRVVNIQQFDATVSRRFNELNISADSTDELVSTFSDRRLAKNLRVFYVTSSVNMASSRLNVSSRVFLPARLGPKQFETMTQTMERVDYWLKVTGAPVFSVETLKLLFSESNANGAEVASGDYTVRAMQGKQWLSAIRVYFATTYTEPDPASLPPLPGYNGSTSSGSCVIV